MKKFLAKNFYRAVSFYRGENALQYVSDYKETQQLSGDELHDYQLKQIKEIAEVAAKSIPFYEEQLVINGIGPDKLETLGDLQHYPVITKSQIQNNAPEFENSNIKGTSYWITTGGSTGKPLRILKDAESLGRRRGAMYRFYDWWNIELGDKQARFWGVPLDIPGRMDERNKDSLMNRRRFNAFNMTEENFKDFYNKMLKFRPTYFYGFVSVIYEFAKYLEDSSLDGSRFGLKAIIVTSETIYPDQREVIHRVFGAPVVVEYGAGEVGIIAFECKKGNLHINSDNIVLESVDGKAVVTELHSRAMPLIRYELGDTIIPADKQGICECGCGFPMIEHISGREVDMIDLGDGSKAHSQALNYVFQDFGELRRYIHQFKVLQNSKDGSIEILITPTNLFDDESDDSIIRVFRDRVGFKGKITIKTVDEIPRDPSGKLRYFAKQ